MGVAAALQLVALASLPDAHLLLLDFAVCTIVDGAERFLRQIYSR